MKNEIRLALPLVLLAQFALATHLPEPGDVNLPRSSASAAGGNIIAVSARDPLTGALRVAVLDGTLRPVGEPAVVSPISRAIAGIVPLASGFAVLYQADDRLMMRTVSSTGILGDAEVVTDRPSQISAPAPQNRHAEPHRSFDSGSDDSCVLLDHRILRCCTPPVR